jgi:hypothetical protein
VPIATATAQLPAAATDDVACLEATFAPMDGGSAEVWARSSATSVVTC